MSAMIHHWSTANGSDPRRVAIQCSVSNSDAENVSRVPQQTIVQNLPEAKTETASEPPSKLDGLANRPNQGRPRVIPTLNY